MAQVQVRDQNGKAVAGIAINLGRRDEPGKRLFTQVTDPAGNTDFEYAAFGIIAFNQLPHNQQWILYLNDVEACNANWKNIERKEVNVDTFAVDNLFVLNVAGSPAGQCPANSDKQGVINYFDSVAASVGAHTNTEANRNAMKDGFAKCGWMWQNQLRPPMRARVYLPPLDSNGASGQYFNTGDENGPFNISFGY